MGIKPNLAVSLLGPALSHPLQAEASLKVKDKEGAALQRAMEGAVEEAEEAKVCLCEHWKRLASGMA